MAKYIYPEDGIKVVTFEKKDDLAPWWPTVVTNIQVNVPATERLKLSWITSCKRLARNS